MGQYGLSKVILEHLERIKHYKLLFNHSVSAIKDDKDSKYVTVTATTPDGPKHYRSEYVVGCDGGRSVVRKLLGVEFEGFTFDEPIIANNVYYDFRKYGWAGGNFIVDPDHWCLIAQLDDKGLWRVSYGEKPGLTPEEYVDPKRRDAKFQAVFPGPHPVEYNCVATSMYRMHQRCSSTFRKGRCLLAGDAARINNPFGG